MANSGPVVLHEYKVTFLWWLFPLFTVLGGLIVALSVGLPLLLDLELDAGSLISIGIAFVVGLAMPVGAVLMWLLIPAITTRYDAAHGLVALEYRRPFGRSVKEYRVAEIADVGLQSMSDNAFSLALVLRSGKRVRIDLSATTNKNALWDEAARLRQALGLQPTILI